MQIGEAAERAGLSIRTLRHYEEAGVVTPSARSEGGFRLYTGGDISRLRLVRQMKPLGFTLEEMRELLTVLDALDGRRPAALSRDEAQERLAMFHDLAQVRVHALREQLDVAETFARTLAEKRG